MLRQKPLSFSLSLLGLLLTRNKTTRHLKQGSRRGVSKRDIRECNKKSSPFPSLTAVRRTARLLCMASLLLTACFVYTRRHLSALVHITLAGETCEESAKEDRGYFRRERV